MRPHVFMFLVLGLVGTGAYCFHLGSVRDQGSKNDEGAISSSAPLPPGAHGDRAGQSSKPTTRTALNRKQSDTDPLVIWRDRYQDLDASNARAMLAEAQTTIKNLNERSLICSEIIGELCARGFIEEAWGLIDNSFGTLRNDEIKSFFSKIPHTEAHLNRILALTDPMEKLSGLEGVASSLEPAQFGDFGKLQKYFASGREKALLADRLGLFLDLPAELREDPQVKEYAKEALDAALGMVRSGYLSDAQLSRIISQDKINDAFYHWTAIEELSGGEAKPNLATARKESIKGMVALDPDRTMSLILESTTRNPDFVASALSEYYGYSNSEATRWLESNLGKLQDAEADNAIMLLISKAAEYREAESVQAWSKLLRSEPSRLKANRKLEELRKRK